MKTIGVGFTVASNNKEGTVIWAKSKNNASRASVVTNESEVVACAVGGPDEIDHDVILITVLGWEAVANAAGLPDDKTNTLKIIGSVAVKVVMGTAQSTPFTSKNAKKYTRRAKRSAKRSPDNPAAPVRGVFNVAADHGTTVTVFGPRGVSCFVDVSETYAARQRNRAQAATSDYRAWKKRNKVVFEEGADPFLQPAMIEAEWSFGGHFDIVPAITGWPQLGRVEFTTAVYWPRATAYAQLLLGVTDEGAAAILREDKTKANPPHLDNVLTVFVVVALTAFAGSYPFMPETVDDRSPGAIKLDRNRDCDDMAITTVAVFNKLAKEAAQHGQRQFGKTLPLRLAAVALRFLTSKYKSAATIVCRAYPHVANPNDPAQSKKGGPKPKLGGHVYAILATHKPDETGASEQLLENATIVESTRVSSPFIQDLHHPMFELNGNRVFCRAHTYDRGEKGIQCVKPLILEQYAQNITANTEHHTYAIGTPQPDGTFKVGADCANMLKGAAKAMKITPESDAAAYDGEAASLCHRLNYDRIDKAVLRYGWKTKLGYDAESQPIAADLDVSNFTHMGDPRQFGKGFKLTEFIVYAWAVVNPSTNQATCLPSI
jgi:hypothetical protein